MSPSSILAVSENISLGLLSVAFLLTVIRVVRGPTLPDRVVGLDMLVATAIGFIGVVAIKTGYMGYLDIAISLGLVGFLSTVAFARFILVRGLRQRREDARNALAAKRWTAEKEDT